VREEAKVQDREGEEITIMTCGDGETVVVRWNRKVT
jgi:hypothetical protein